MLYRWKKKAGLKATYDTYGKELKQLEEENRILRKLLSHKEIELEVWRELLKKSLERPIQKNLVRSF
ncbi:hypothetical protein [Cellulophaga sp. E16_2]|uniref:hypothetical protein n=1 Tax=unclassified Cellulophaga TaxID=2634405 RepID=UPI003211AD76